ncbi:hypothetical protein AYO44_02220 [Planctomycetaceae bacterium SCGC AG-212-F19]|nr:hypothetical protein AYO44_02220 [Planctomycetaceae bacterium SCGC AG-212-F19]
MTTKSMMRVATCMQTWIDARRADGLSSGQLLERFLDQADECAFATLVQRHAGAVWRICLRVLGNFHDAEDAFQATFLILARKGASIGRAEVVDRWLCRVAYRIALRARMLAQRRAERERTALWATAGRAPGASPDELRRQLDDDVGRLPAKYREPVVLCYFAGVTYAEAARLLGEPAGTVSARLSRARALLRQRLGRQGLPGTAPPLAALPPAPAACISGILRAAGGQVPLSPVVADLITGGAPTMLLSKFKFAWVLLLAGGIVFCQGRSSPPTAAPPAPAPAERADGAVELGKPGQPLPESIWSDLASTEQAVVFRAVMALGAAGPKQAVAYFQGHLRPVSGEPERVAQLLADLDSEQLELRTRAAEELEYLGECARPHLLKALTAKPALELRQRLEQLLSKLGGTAPATLIHFGMAPYGTYPSQLIYPQYQPLLINPTTGGLMPATNRPLLHNGIGYPTFTGFPSQPPAPPPAKPNPLWVRSGRAVAILESIGTPEARAVLEKVAGGEAKALPTTDAKAALDRLSKKAAD